MRGEKVNDAWLSVETVIGDVAMVEEERQRFEKTRNDAEDILNLIVYQSAKLVSE